MLITDFIKEYCKNSKITEERLIELNLVALPCNCGEDNCKGFAMVHRENITQHLELYWRE